MQELWTYIKSPKYIRKVSFNFVQFSCMFIMIVPCCLGLSILNSQFIGIVKIERLHTDHDLSQIIFYSATLIPFTEEFFFRFLLKPKFRNVLIFIIVNIFFGLYFVWTNKYLAGNALLFLGVIPLFVLIVNKSFLRKIQIKQIKYFPYIFYMSVLCFGFLHLSNFNFPSFNFWIFFLSPIIVLPQIIGGITLGFIRMKYGFLYSVIFHSLNNLIPFILFYFNKLL